MPPTVPFATDDDANMIIALIGDSDISRWPSELYPSLINMAADKLLQQQKGDDEAPAAAPSSGGTIIVSGHSGATLHEVIPHVQETLANILLSQKDENQSSGVDVSTHSHKDRRRRLKKNKKHVTPKPNTVGSDNDDDDDFTTTSIFLVICAGENDIGNGISLTDSTQSLDELLSSILNHPLFLLAEGNNIHDNDDDNVDNKNVQVGIIFLGPKLEPWLKYDASARKDYIRMSRSFEACFQRHCDDIARQCSNTTRTTTKRPHRSVFSLAYVDCLTMFCGDNAHKIPGALMGGKAQALDVYFDRDQLHLSNEGYKIWKQVIENVIRDMMPSSFKHA